MTKKLLTILLAGTMALQPITSSAADLNAAFDNLLGSGTAVSVNTPGRYQSGARNSFIAGGMDLRVPKVNNSPQLFSFTPPRITKGCNGISAHFGGFSFISGAEFEKLLKSIASGAALGFVSMMAMKALCPSCEAVVQFLKTAAQQASRLAIDSCKMGKDAARSFMDNAQPGAAGDPTTVCGASISDAGGSSDFLSAMDNGCKSITGAIDALLGQNSQANGNSTQAQLNRRALSCDLPGVGNMTWQRLAVFDEAGTTALADETDEGYLRKLLLMNMLGAEFGNASSDMDVGCEHGETTSVKDKEDNKILFCPPRLRPADAMGLFLCGAPDGNGKPPGNPSSRVAEYCSTFYTAKSDNNVNVGSFAAVKSATIYKCKSNDLVNCSYLESTGADYLFKGEGYLVQISKALQEGVNAVRNNTAMPVTTLKLMQKVPYPLYQAINAAAVYPSAASDLLDAMSVLIAEQLAISEMDEMLRVEGRSGSNQPTCLSAKQGAAMMDAIGAMRAANYSRRQMIAQNITMQEAISEQIRQINLAIQKQVMTQDMLASNRYAQAVGRAVAPNVSAGQGATAAAPTKP